MATESNSPLETCRAIVRSFDVRHDTAMMWHEATGELEKLGAFLPPAEEHAERNAVYLGALWCRLVAADVSYDLSEARRITARGGPVAARLARADLDEFGQYVLARWHDVNAKISFRYGDMTAARRAGERAVGVASRGGLWWCLPDLESNQERYRQSEQRDRDVSAAGVGLDPEPYLTHLGAALGRVPSPNLRAPGVEPLLESLRARAGAPGGLTGALNEQEREFLRGVCSLLHNAASTTRKPETDAQARESLRWSEQAERIAVLLGDKYRRLQSLICQAHLHAKRLSPPDPTRARQLYEAVASGEWTRGRLMARQNLAIIARDAGALDAIAEQVRSAPGGVQDVDFYVWTLRAAVDATAPVPGAPPPDTEENRRRERQIVDSIRSVTSVPQYKNLLSASAFPALLREIASAHSVAAGPAGESDRFDRAAALVSTTERAAARELLDLLAVGFNRPRGSPSIIPLTGALQDRVEKLVVPHRAAMETRLCRLFDSESATMLGELEDAVHQMQSREEEAWLEDPIPTQRTVDGVGESLSQFTEENKGALVLRYYQLPDSHGGRYAVVAALDGEWIGPEVLPGELAEFLARWGQVDETQLSEPIPGKFSDELARAGRELWRLMLLPIVERLGAERWRRIKRLILIPFGELFDAPINAIVVPGDWASRDSGADAEAPLLTLKPVSACVSVEALVTRQRWWYRRCKLAERDGTLVIDPYNVVYRDEAPDRPQIRVERDAPAAFAELSTTAPKCLVLVGHGAVLKKGGPILLLQNTVLSQFGIASQSWLTGTSLVMLVACVSGRGAGLRHGETAGFIRGLMCAGAKAMLVTSWHVGQLAARAASKEIISRLYEAKGGARELDALLCEVYRTACARAVEEKKGLPLPWERQGVPDKALRRLGAQIESIPFLLYL